MDEVGFLLVGLFLPLFPLSIVFNALLRRVDQPLVRSAIILAWPQIGLLVLSTLGGDLPSWLVVWALATAMLYAFRLLAMREVKRWTAFLATSSWAVLWLPVLGGVVLSEMWQYAAAFSLPLTFLTLLARSLERRFGAAYTGLYGGLALSTPRFAGILVVTVLAATATPLFPSFFTMLSSMVASRPEPAITLTIVWLVWSWAGARLLQGLIVGTAVPDPSEDLDIPSTWGYTIALAGLVLAGLFLTGRQL